MDYSISHITHIYECDDMLLDSMYHIIDAFCDRKIKAAEKLDGQNFTFTVTNREVKFLGKGIIKRFSSIGGLGRKALEKEYEDKPQQSCFLHAYDTLQNKIQSLDESLIEGFFANGAALHIEILNKTNRNVICYDDSGLYAINGIGDYCEDAYNRLIRSLNLKSVPFISFNENFLRGGDDEVMES